MDSRDSSHPDSHPGSHPGSHPDPHSGSHPDDRVARIQAEWRRERPDVDVSPQAVVGRLHRLAGRLTAELRIVYDRYGLGEGEFDVLCALRRAGEPFERAPGELAAHTMVTTGAMTKRIDRLERAGLVTRRRSGDDQRARIVALTRPGLDLVDRAFADHMRNERRLLDLLTADEAASLEALLTSWLARMETPPTAGDRPAGPPR
ncbi:MarR family winged helix-turn-helix transcriptional regulator [Streptomyces zhihengii]